ncbi:DUF2306 domain-containing protein [Couchioplanes caeruleus]|uniref:Uncharacterized protein n=2 Tax=Couchioplanes caeruleus TaxID=56438 RepID=A0A1K0FFU9_9ACTN|nr:DUF2306 domain-containing protein [Couchioplanes caeruleus]OJF11600.1 hypothetical protein BG844_25345 [Couchioplanes caeruleus subsp. caeruleus]ROP32904.1 putative membrane protein [Couchioplanes caeruleus]
MASRTWLAPTGLVVLALVPSIAGALRLTQLATGAESTPARFADLPLPVAIHILTAVPYLIVGAFQFSRGLRRRRPRWHRVAGRILVVCGLLAAASGLWMTAGQDLPASDNAATNAYRIVFGSGMVAAILLGFAAIRRRDFRAHEAWMIRAYAIGMGAGTQVLTHVPWQVALGTPSPFTRSFLMLAGWVINVAVAEWIIRRRPVPPARRRRPLRVLAEASANSQQSPA